MRSPTNAGPVGLLVAALVSALLLLGACSSGSGTPGSSDTEGTASPATSDSAPSTPSSPSTPASTSPSAASDPVTPAADGRVRYVALGDSYVSAPGLPSPADGNTQCARSTNDYPHLIAAADPAVKLHDVSCSGAPIADVEDNQALKLSKRTDLVTVGIGANDSEMLELLLERCGGYGTDDSVPGSPCTDALESTYAARLDPLGASLDEMMRQITQRAPNATVLVIGYPQLLPASGSCPARVPMAPGDYAFINDMDDRMDDALAGAAAAHGAGFVDVAAASQGHDICSAEPWVNGQDTSADGVIPFHPLLAEQQAVARLVLARTGLAS